MPATLKRVVMVAVSVTATNEIKWQEFVPEVFDTQTGSVRSYKSDDEMYEVLRRGIRDGRWRGFRVLSLHHEEIGVVPPQRWLEIELGTEFIAVPFDALCLNGIYLRKLNSVDPATFKGFWALVSKTKGYRAVDDSCQRPYRYMTWEEIVQDAEYLGKQNGEYSVCP